MKEKIKKNRLSGIILIVTALLITIFSGLMLLKISRLNYSIYNHCEPKEYIAWTKEIKIFLTPERILELEDKITSAGEEKKRNIQEYGAGKTPFNFAELYESTIERNKKLLEQGYEIAQIPDEERREASKKEEEDYKNCLKYQELAMKQHPETYKFLLIGDVLIAMVGLLVVFAAKEK